MAYLIHMNCMGGTVGTLIFGHLMTDLCSTKVPGPTENCFSRVIMQDPIQDTAKNYRNTHAQPLTLVVIGGKLAGSIWNNWHGTKGYPVSHRINDVRTCNVICGY